MKDGLYWVQQLKEQKVSHTELLKDIEKKSKVKSKDQWLCNL